MNGAPGFVSGVVPLARAATIAKVFNVSQPPALSYRNGGCVRLLTWSVVLLTRPIVGAVWLTPSVTVADENGQAVLQVPHSSEN